MALNGETFIICKNLSKHILTILSSSWLPMLKISYKLDHCLEDKKYHTSTRLVIYPKIKTALNRQSFSNGKRQEYHYTKQWLKLYFVLFTVFPLVAIDQFLFAAVAQRQRVTALHATVTDCIPD